MLWVDNLLSALLNRRASDFSGLGIVFYRSPIVLPCYPMGEVLPEGVKLPLTGIEEIVECLVKASSYQSEWHDGFHLIDLECQSLSHMCQFLSPSSELIFSPAKGSMPVGSRYFTAQAISRLPCVFCCAVVNSQGVVSVFECGEVGVWKI